MQTIFVGVKEMARKKRNPASVQIANAIIEAYKPESIAEMNEAIKEVCGPMFEAILRVCVHNRFINV